MDESQPPADALEHDARDDASTDRFAEGAEHRGARGEPPWIRPRPPLRVLDVLVLVAVLALSAVVHFARLATPDRPLPADDEQCRKFPRLSSVCHEMIPLDEWHYLPDARDVILYGTESDTRVPSDDGAYVVHPPIAKRFIAWGIQLFGDAGFGWRFFGALFGTLSTLIMYLFARRLWPSPWPAAAAAFLITVEGLWFVMSRVAMLDIYASTFMLTGVWMLVEDRARAVPGARRARWWRVGAGAMFGLAIASKWSVAPFLVTAVAFAFAWDLRAAAWNHEGARGVWKRVGALALTFGVLPFALYVGSYTPWFVDEHRYHPPLCEREVERTGLDAAAQLFGQWWCYQGQMLDFHRHLEKFTTEEAEPDATPGTGSPTATGELKPAHPYFGNAWAWPWIGRPVAHHYRTEGQGDAERVEHVLSAPNPVIWFAGFFVGLPLLLWRTARGNDRVAPLLFALFMAGWLPYLFADLVGRPVFLFYATPMVPFVVLGLVHVGVRAHDRFPAETKAVAIAFVSVAALMFAYLYPVLASYPVSQDGFWGWTGRMLLRQDCGVENAIKNACWI